ncbi:peptidase domain-containing ABC transporter [Piscirickettsia litoralis]|uniref:ABC transporter family protein n=1 Tax=Piscirickettsia litoralis TaxID=1891921 RepID=A0ABX3A4Q8_9GAMM|nr:ABC transporter transmembrane domain-containing protein [Piscirickettsia litoralis]ODN42380.1 ABC transporter family protein [Piscirickettsia litoralis]
MSSATVQEHSIRTAFINCLEPLLTSLGWQGDQRSLNENLPHFTEGLDLSSFRQVMLNLRYNCTTMRTQLNKIDTRLLPCLFISDEGRVLVVISVNQFNQYTVFDGAANIQLTLPELVISGMSYFFKAIGAEDELANKSQANQNWFGKILGQNKKLIYHTFFISFLINLLAISTPLFIMAVYDRVISTNSTPMLWSFTIGVGIALISIGVLYLLRSHILAFISARLDRDIGNAIFQHLLYLSPSYTESATVGAQVARLKDFDNIREFLTGSLVSIIFELPFIVLFFAVIAILGHWLALVPITMGIILFIVALLLHTKAKSQIKDTAQSNSQRQEFLLESLRLIRTIKYTGAQKIWYERYRELSGIATLDNLKNTVITAAAQAVADNIMIAAGLAILFFGVFMVFSGTLTVGALIAVMILTWKILSPIKTLFTTLPRLEQLVVSIRQINLLMQLELESQPGTISANEKHHFKGNISFNRVSIRYSPTLDPALIGASFNVEAGHIVGVIGRNGSGKSTLLKLIPGLYQPQAGSILIDNCDIRQINPISLRHAIAYVPQEPQLFYGSIAQNLRLSCSGASDEELYQAAKEAGVLDDILSLPKQFDSPIRDGAHLASSFQQRLSLARAYLKKAPILLMDEPANGLDYEADQCFIETIKKLRGHTTIILVTHRPSHLKHADQVLLLDQGQILRQGPPDEILPTVPKDLL